MIDWDDVLLRMADGAAICEICCGRDGLPTKWQWRKKKADDAAFASRVDEIAIAQGRATTGRLRRLKISVREIHWERALDRFASGESAAAIARHDDGMPTTVQWFSRIRKDAEFAAQVAAIALKLNPARQGQPRTIDWERALRRLEAGERVRGDICTGRDDMPALHQWRRKKDIDAAFAARVDALTVKSRDVGNRLAARTASRHAQRRSSIDWDGFFVRIRAGEGLEAVAASGYPMPSITLIQLRRRSDHAFDASLAEALESRPEILTPVSTIIVDTLRSGENLSKAAAAANISIVTAWRISSRLSHVTSPLISAIRRKVRGARPKRVLPDRFSGALHREEFVRALRSDEVYAAVYEAGKRLPRDIRDDVISDVIVAVLDGKISMADVPNEIARFRVAHNRMFSSYAPSLDAPMGVDGSFTLGNSLVAAYV